MKSLNYLGRELPNRQPGHIIEKLLQGNARIAKPPSLTRLASLRASLQMAE